MTLDQLKALPVGSLVKIFIDDQNAWEIGEVTANSSLQAIVIWPESGVTQFIGYTKAWESFVEWLEVEE